MIKVDFFSIRWSSLARLDEFFFNTQNTYFLELLDAVVESKTVGEPIEEYNPIIIKAPTASGKTHLLEAIAMKMHENKPELKIGYGKASGLIAIFNDKKSQARRIQELQSCDVLLLDDIQTLVGYSQVQEELAMLIDALLEKGTFIAVSYAPNKKGSVKQVFNSSYDLENSLSSRIFSGLNFNLENPDLDVRMRIAEQCAEKLEVRITKSMCLTIARFTQDARQVKGIIKTIFAYVKATGFDLSEEELQGFLDKFESKGAITPDLIIAFTARYYNIQQKDLKGKSRQKDIILARQVSMYLCRKLLNLPYLSIAEIFGGKDHSTVMHAYKKIEKQTNLKNTLEMLSQKISQSASLMTGIY